MGDVITFAIRHHVRPRRVMVGGPTTTADIVFFTGVRIERRADRPSDRRDDPALDPQPPRGRRRRARSGP